MFERGATVTPRPGRGATPRDGRACGIGRQCLRGKAFTIVEKEVSAAAQLARGQKEDAVRLAKEASDVEASMSAPSGPPDPIKPAAELYGEVLLDAGQPVQAAAAFEKSLERTPNRRASPAQLARDLLQCLKRLPYTFQCESKLNPGIGRA